MFFAFTRSSGTILVPNINGVVFRNTILCNEKKKKETDEPVSLLKLFVCMGQVLIMLRCIVWVIC